MAIQVLTAQRQSANLLAMRLAQTVKTKPRVDTVEPPVDKTPLEATRYPIAFRLPENSIERLTKYAKSKGLTKASVLRGLIDQLPDPQ